MASLRIGEEASRAGVSLQAILCYERRGLLKPPREPSSYQAFPEEAIQRVRFIKKAQALGFSLEEIKELLSLWATPRTRCAGIRSRAEVKVKDIDERMRALQLMRSALTKLIGECSGSDPVTQCPVLGALDGEEVGRCCESS